MPADKKTEKSGSIPEVDPVVHAPARLAILSLLYVSKVADFLFLERQTGLTRGNLSTHLTKLESAGYVEIEKKFEGRVPRTLLHLTKTGKKALRDYRKQMQATLRDLPE